MEIEEVVEAEREVGVSLSIEQGYVRFGRLYLL